MRTCWFGLLAGWLDLGVAWAQRVVRPHVAIEMVRANLHLGWMIPLSIATAFGVVGGVLAVSAWFRPGLARWASRRAPVGLLFLVVLLEIEGLSTTAVFVLACGLALRLGPLIDRGAERFDRLIRLSLPAMALGTAAAAGLIHVRLASAESRALAARPPARTGAPNVLLVVLDTVRAENLSLHGYGRPTTPNLQRLARRGVLFTEARTTAPWTAPSHGSLMTGRWPSELSVAPGVPLDATFPTLAEVMGGAGYATAGFVGNLDCCNALYGIDRGFDRYEDAYENQTVSLVEAVGSSALGRRLLQAAAAYDGEFGLQRKTAAMLNRDLLGWLARRPAGRPFFAFVNYYDAHRPYRYHVPRAARFGAAALSFVEQAELEGVCLDAIAGRPGESGLTPEQAGLELTRMYGDAYDTCIAYVDAQLGLLVDEMERRGELENTLIVVTSDHGEEIGERGQLVHGASVYSTETHVPLVVVPPAGSSRAGVVTDPVSLRDVAATIAEWTGLGPRSPFPGHPLTQHAASGWGRPANRSPALSELTHVIAFPPNEPIPPPFGRARSLVARNRLYIRRPEGSEELYDLRNDPQETMDLAKNPGSARIVEQFREELHQLGRETVSPRS